MATIRREVTIAADPAAVWDALRDVGALHTRLCPGFVTSTVMEKGVDGDERVVTFGNGATARERIVSVDDTERRVVWSIVGTAAASGAGAPQATEKGLMTHHNGAAQVFAVEGGTQFVWIADVLPDAVASVMAPMMEQGIAVIKRTLTR